MTYYDTCLKFADLDECRAALYDGDKPKYAAIDIIGIFHQPTGRKIPVAMVEGQAAEMVDEMAPIVGWHANVRHTEPMPELDAWKITPTTPMRVWFGE